MFAIVDQDIDPQALSRGMRLDSCGGFVSFEGWVRDHNEGRAVKGLYYEAYATLAEKEGHKIIDEAMQRFDIRKAACQHRVGDLDIGGIAVWVGVSSDHRDAAFRACRYIIDEIKARLPIWKKEYYTDGDTEWVDCRECAKHAHHHHADDSRTGS
ncbi:MAG: molybdenum cofactor biosynthesis protein MoaE [bacterium]